MKMQSERWKQEIEKENSKGRQGNQKNIVIYNIRGCENYKKKTQSHIKKERRTYAFYGGKLQEVNIDIVAKLL